MGGDFLNNLGPDSLDTVEIVMVFEEAYDLPISDEEMTKIIKKFRTKEELIDYLRKRRKGGN